MTNPTAFTPDELADRLDDLLANPQQPVTDPTLQTASRLINARPPELSAAAYTRIQQQLLDAAAQPPALQTKLLQTPGLLILVVATGIALVIVILALIFSALQNRDAVLPATFLPETAPTEIPFSTTENSVLSATPMLTETLTLTPMPTETTLLLASFTPMATATLRASATVVLPSQTPQPSILPSASNTPLPPTLTLSPTKLNTITPSATNIPATAIPNSATPSIEHTASAQLEQPATPTATRTAAPLTTLVIEGKIETIDVNQIVIFGIPILLDPSHPLLASLRVGDEVRIEAVVVQSGGLMIMSAITVEVTSVAIFIDEATGAVFRDDSDCSNPPPSWAPANGWRARCESGAAPGNSGNAPGNSGNAPGDSGNAPGNAGGMGNNDDDD